MPKFVIKKGELASRQEPETPPAPQPQGSGPKFVIHKKEPETPPAPQPQAGGPKFVIHKKEQPQPQPQQGKQVRILKAAHGSAYPGVRETVEGGRYRIDKVIGGGGAGRVCLAYDLLLDMPVAIKFLNPDLIRDEMSINALKTETKICLQLVHKHVVRIFNLEKRGNNFMLIMEYLKGETLFDLISRFPQGLELDFTAQVVSVVTDALAYAHRHGILHKDLTPGNIIITEDGVLKVIDFGIASNVNIQESGEIGDTVVGTPSYMSPEQLRGERLDQRTDIYSLGVLVHQMLTGRTIETQGASIQDIAYTPRPPIRTLPQPLADVLMTATAFSPADRWESMESFGAAFADAVRRTLGSSAR